MSIRLFEGDRLIAACVVMRPYKKNPKYTVSHLAEQRTKLHPSLVMFWCKSDHLDLSRQADTNYNNAIKYH
jgi:hypothetical protein